MALQHIHRCGFVHGDVKSANILFSEDFRVQLADFGLAVHQQLSVQELDSMKHNHEISGTPGFVIFALFFFLFLIIFFRVHGTRIISKPSTQYSD